MADNLGGVSSPEQLIRTYKETVRKCSFARRCVSIAIVGIILIYVGLIWKSVTDFRTRDLPTFMVALGTEVSNMAPKLTADVGSMVRRTMPQFQSALEKKAKESWPRMEAEMDSEMAVLENYASKKWPSIQTGILHMLETQQNVVIDELKSDIGPQEVERIAKIYAQALRKKYEDVVNLTLGGYGDAVIKNAKEIGAILNQLPGKEPDLAKPTNLAEVVGMLLELVGAQMQQSCR